MANYETYFCETWPLLQQAALYRPGTALGFGNPDFDAASLRVLIVRLSPFRDVNRSTPHLFLFQAVRRALPEAYIDFAFLPPEHDRRRWLADGVPLLVGMRSWRDLAEFDVVLISNAYTLELINLPYLLLNSGVPVLASQRDETWPPLILGGSNAMAAQAVLVAPDPSGSGVVQTGVVDALFFGEGEREVSRLVAELRANASLPKAARLQRAAAAVTGLWVVGAGGATEGAAAEGRLDAGGQGVTKAVCHDPQAADLVVQYPSFDSEEASTGRLQINFGCPSFCSFCFEGYDRKPYREVDSEAILQVADALKVTQGVDTLDVYSFNFNTQADVLGLLLALNERFDRVNVMSQRVDLLAVMPSLLEAEIRADKRSFTLGIEGISRRMRAFLHKSLDDRELNSVLVRLMRERIRELKLFYILTGHEDEEDLAEFHRFVLDVKEWRRTTRPGLRVVFSFGLLIRMPFTPLRYDRLFLDEEDWRGISGAVKSSCETNGFEFRLAVSWEEYATSQVLAMGGTWLSQPLLALAAEGHCYDLTLSPGYWDALRDWMTGHGHWSPAFLGERGPDAHFPLDFVASDLRPEFLYAQYQQAVAGIDEGYCLGEVGNLAGIGQAGRCLGCGACTLPEERAAIVGHTMQHPGTGYLQRLEETMRRKWRQQPLYVRLWLPETVAGMAPAWINAFVMRSLLAAYPDQHHNLLSAQEVVFTTKANLPRYAGLFGETVVALKAWEPEPLIARLLGGVSLPIAQTFGGSLSSETPRDQETPKVSPHVGQHLAGNLGDLHTGGLRFLGLLDAYEPGTFQQARMVMALPAGHFPDAGRRLRQYLQAQYVPVNLRGLASTGAAGAGYVFDIPAKARKKRVILEGVARELDGIAEVEIVVTPKFDLLDYLRAFPEPDRYREAQVAVRELVL